MDNLKLGLTFDDVALVPYFSNLKSRTEPILRTRLTKNIWVNTPLIASNMESVIGEDLADVLLYYGSMPIFHRFTDDETILNWINKYGHKTFISWGVTNLNRLFKILDKCDKLPIGLCFDIAHAHTNLQKYAIKAVKKNFNIDIIGGNVCSKTATHDLISWGVDAIRIGIGAGSICKTRMVTGFGVPQFSSIIDCAYVANQHDIPIICDGGIRDSRDIILALAAGASCIMTGNLFAATNESSALKEVHYGKKFARYRGQASEIFQRPGLASEGVEGWISVTGSAIDLIEMLQSQLKSGLSMGGAHNIKELQRHAKFIKVTSSYIKESYTRV